jgi:hypothetical protein
MLNDIINLKINLSGNYSNYIMNSISALKSSTQSVLSEERGTNKKGTTLTGKLLEEESRGMISKLSDNIESTYLNGNRCWMEFILKSLI